MYELAGFRAFQGIGAGGIMPLALAVIGDFDRAYCSEIDRSGGEPRR